MILIYDGSFEGFLTLVYDVYYDGLRPVKICRVSLGTLSFEESLEIVTDVTKATKVLEALKSRFKKESFQRVLNIFMCDSEEFEMNLLRYIILGFKNQKELQNINHSFVYKIDSLEKEIFRNSHKMSGFLRFEELVDNTLYGKLESRFNLSIFLGRHFLKRLNNQNFIIHDIKRELAFIKNENFCGVQKVAKFEIPELSDDEEKFKKLWQTFFDSVTIKSRENTKLQKNLVPLIYRTYMSEFIN